LKSSTSAASEQADSEAIAKKEGIDNVNNNNIADQQASLGSVVQPGECPVISFISPFPPKKESDWFYLFFSTI
jgi:hypothetical protein